ncbi:hypothetical protein ACFYQA_07915 [Streptomyces sp. NPDC005774]
MAWGKAAYLVRICDQTAEVLYLQVRNLWSALLRVIGGRTATGRP